MMSGWHKIGHIFTADKQSDWMYSHAMIPIAERIEGDRYRVYFSVRDKQNRGHGAYLELDMKDPLRVQYLHDKPVLEPGALGCFDDSGALPNSIVTVAGKKRLYYTGINLGVTVKIRNSIGVAEWNEEKHCFERLYPGPIIDRTKELPHFTATPEVMFDGKQFHCWFTRCVRWEAGEQETKHYYNLEYAHSGDGIHWQRDGHTAIDFRDANEYALGVPRVIQDADRWRMWFCARATKDVATYRICYAESDDGKHWQRKDELVGIDISPEGWDSQMICYPFVFDHEGKRYMLYNGNHYGLSGFGLAVWEA